MNFLFFNHQNKGNMLLNALKNDSSGKFTEYEYKPSGDYSGRSKDGNKIDFVLTDNDVLGRQKKLESLYQAGIRKFFLYPHAARPNLYNDIYPAWDKLTAQFVVSEGHIEILRRYGYEKPLHSIGWHICPMRPYTPKLSVQNNNIHKVLNILFAPIHPRLAEVDKKANQAAWKRLYKLAKQGDINLTVRYIRSLQDSGLDEAMKIEEENYSLSRYGNNPLINFYKGELDSSYNMIDRADVVVAHQTFAYIAVARGVPTVMFAEDMPTHLIFRNGDGPLVKSWDKYRDLLMYPLDLLNTDHPMDLLEKAAINDNEIKDWRKRMIGTEFNPNQFIRTLEIYL